MSDRATQGKPVALFPYQIKNRNLFYDRDHPKDVHPDTMFYRSYWKQRLQNYIEGRWVNDEGTWVYMYPALDFYTNYARIPSSKRDTIHPHLRDVEWIFFTYFFGCDGFSGFEDDDKYTCHHLAGKKQAGEELDAIEEASIPKECYRDNGNLKIYKHPWEYLTRTYLLDDPRDKPLGLPLFQNPKQNGAIFTCRGLGKDQRWDTKVYTDEGVRLIKDINVGDKIYGADGKLTTVIDRADFYNQLQYKVTFADGRYTYCGDGHLWEVYKAGGRGRDEPYVLPLKEIRKKYKGYERVLHGGKKKRDILWYVKQCEPVGFPEKELFIDPYILGLWLGDGASSQASLTSEDKEVIDAWVSYGETLGLKANYLTKKDSKNPNLFTVSLVTDGGNRKNVFVSRLREYNLINNKHIPEDYLYASVEQRLELLKGFMDTDGTSTTSGNCSFVQKSKKVTDGICHILGSLGIKYKRGKKILRFFEGKKLETPLEYHRVNINTSQPIFKLKRKAERLVTDPTSAHSIRMRKFNGIVSIEPVEVDHSVCLGLDNEDKLYVCDDFIVTHNSLSAYVGYLGHKFLTSGITRWEDRKNINKRLLFFLGGPDGQQFQRSVDNLRDFYYDMPGKFEFTDPGIKPVQGALFKRLQGSWDVSSGGKLQHITKTRANKDDILGSSIEHRPLRTNNLKVAAGDRFAAILVDEAGFLSQLLDFYNKNKDSMKIGDETVGSLIVTGTSGSMETIKGPKKMLDSPEDYNIFSIPDYFKNPDRRIGLFIPVYYKFDNYKDEHGNTYLDLCYEKCLRDREKEAKKGDAAAYDSEVMFNPLVPDEMMVPSKNNILPAVEARNQLNDIEAYDLFRKRAIVGSLKWNPPSPYGVKFEPDFANKLTPITEWSASVDKDNCKGAFIKYEEIPEKIPENLYWVIFDPPAKQGLGSSLSSVLVYKHFYSGSEATLYDTIVGEWIGRYERLEDNYEMVIKIAKMYNARIFPETNVAGFVDWCRQNDYFDMLESDAYQLDMEIMGNKAIKRSYYRVGFQLRGGSGGEGGKSRHKFWALQKARDWLKEVKIRDPESGVPRVRTIDWIFSPRLLDEIINYNATDNFDHISSLLGLMLLIGKLSKEPVEIDEVEEQRTYHVVPKMKKSRARPKFLR